MAMNPMQLLQLSERLKIFREQHPRVLEFLHAVARDNIQPGVIMELNKSEAIWDIANLIRQKVILPDDLSDFSEELQQDVKRILEVN